MSEEGRAAKDRSRAARIDPAHEHGKFALGCLTDPRRAVDARFRSRSVDGVEIHGATTQTTVSNLEDVSAQPRRGDCRDRLCVVPTVTFERLFAFLVVGHGRRRLLWFDVTRHPTAEWLARQMTEAFPWASTPAYLIRDNDRAYGQAFTTRVTAMGIRDRPISPGAPWQNGITERLIGTLRRECLDHVVIFGEAHLRRVLSLYAVYYNQTRTHLALHKDCPLKRPVQRFGSVTTIPILAGLHHQYFRI